MAGNHRGLFRRKLTLHDVEIGAANPTGAHSEKDMAGLELGIGDVSDSQRAL
jgi:hypothetical protein